MLSTSKYSYPTEPRRECEARRRENSGDDSEYVFREPSDIHIRGKQAHDIHIYEVDGQGEIQNSCCGSFNLSSKEGAGGNIKSSSEARQEAAGKKRAVCGRCVASLYSNRDAPMPQGN